RDRNVTGVQTCALPILHYTVVVYLKMFHVAWVSAFLKRVLTERICQYYKSLMIYRLRQSISCTTRNYIDHIIRAGNIPCQIFQIDLHNKLQDHVMRHSQAYKLLVEKLFPALMQLKLSQLARPQL